MGATLSWGIQGYGGKTGGTKDHWEGLGVDGG